MNQHLCFKINRLISKNNTIKDNDVTYAFNKIKLKIILKLVKINIARLVHAYRVNKNYLEHGNRCDSGLGHGVFSSERTGLEGSVREGRLQGVQQVDHDIDELLGALRTAFRNNILKNYRNFVK